MGLAGYSLECAIVEEVPKAPTGCSHQVDTNDDSEAPAYRIGPVVLDPGLVGMDFQYAWIDAQVCWKSLRKCWGYSSSLGAVGF